MTRDSSPAKVGLKYQIARRSKGARFIVPCVMHWKLGHFAAITAQKGARYELKDPTFGIDGSTLCVSAQALESETDGYSVVPAGSLPQGWSSVSAEEAKTVWGKGYVGGVDDGPKGGPPCGSMCCAVGGSNGSSPSSGGSNGGSAGGGAGVGGSNAGTTGGPINGGGMARATYSTMQATLTIYDTPVGYQPPLGPTINCLANYNYLEINQPGTFTFTNLGQDWSFNWLSYMTVDPGTSIATLRRRGGGSEVFTPNGSSYYPGVFSQAQLVKIGTNNYQLQFPDGSIETFNQADTSSPPRLFMTEITDPQGNSALVQYDTNFRITTITDAINQVTTVSYVSNTVGNSGFYKIAQITDPFSRSCSFTYDSTNTYLLSITDVIGLKSQFIYDSGSSMITSMTTPYGTTSFYQYIPGQSLGYNARGLRFTYPDGTNTELETWMSTSVVTSANTYLWDREATMLYPNDPLNQIYTHCRTTHWLVNTQEAQTLEPVPQWTQGPLESQIQYTYAGQPGSGILGTSNKPTQVTQGIGHPVVAGTVGGTPRTGDVITITAYALGLPYNQEAVSYTVQSTDTLPTIAAGLAAAINADANLIKVGITAVTNSTTSPTFSIMSLASSYYTFYGTSTSGGATETVAIQSIVPQTALITIAGTATTGDVLTMNITDYGSTQYWT